MKTFDVVIVGAGGAGLMCAITAGERGKSVLVIDHAKKAAEKIRISGGGRCNFTNLHISAENYISQNRHFCKSALVSFSQYDFIDWVQDADIAYHERDHGQLFCDGSAQDIIDMLLKKCKQHHVTICLDTSVEVIEKDEFFYIRTSTSSYQSISLVVATGALSIPKMGATAFGLHLAKQFGLPLVEPYPGLVPFAFTGQEKEQFKALAGISLPVIVSLQGKRCKASFKEAMLFTHRGLSGPAMLQISSYWQPGDSLELNLLVDFDLRLFVQEQTQQRPLALLSTVLAVHFPKRLVALLAEYFPMQQKMQSLTVPQLQALEDFLSCWKMKPSSTEGYRTAEVTVGGVDTDALSSKTMQAKAVSGLFFIGEVVDVTGHLGGFNFQWAWSSGYCAGRYV